MTSKTLKSAIWLTLVASAVALAAPGGVEGPPEGKGRKPPTEATNNLSVPAIMVAGIAGNLTTCGGSDWSTLVPPTGTPLSGYTIDLDAFYFVQKVHKWQAQCKSAAAGTLSVFGGWGDNLAGDAALKAGSPIRVELVLTDASGAVAQGYDVVKLEPDKLDRESAYGTLATEDGAGSYAATAADLVPVVHDGGTSLLIVAVDPATDFEVFINQLTPEINATGKVVYGYNLTVPAPGLYDITFTMPNVTYAGCDVADTCVIGGHTATMRITVTGGGGGGGGNRPPRP